ncbi:hypothetical protein B0T25DRAFT_612728 [Lasiosphaeria hispida]|uniref:Uncharacterized protein n=1 Tax=Lasiosphaeria hispida TaxID=260671 RepID=A0AAJ0HB29_9PEZI|nr:hypothetical protein B0T25DRAFT_612728 [Lasiosphaeria hispida]
MYRALEMGYDEGEDEEGEDEDIDEFLLMEGLGNIEDENNNTLFEYSHTSIFDDNVPARYNYSYEDEGTQDSRRYFVGNLGTRKQATASLVQDQDTKEYFVRKALTPQKGPDPPKKPQHEVRILDDIKTFPTDRYPTPRLAECLSAVDVKMETCTCGMYLSIGLLSRIYPTSTSETLAQPVQMGFRRSTNSTSETQCPSGPPWVVHSAGEEPIPAFDLLEDFLDLAQELDEEDRKTASKESEEKCLGDGPLDERDSEEALNPGHRLPGLWYLARNWLTLLDLGTHHWPGRQGYGSDGSDAGESSSGSSLPVAPAAALRRMDWRLLGGLPRNRDLANLADDEEEIPNIKTEKRIKAEIDDDNYWAYLSRILW